MSSACVCHTDEWCFYCNMYSPLEKAHERLKMENDWLREEKTKYEQHYRNYLDMFTNQVGITNRLIRVMKWYADPSHDPESRIRAEIVLKEIGRHED